MTAAHSAMPLVGGDDDPEDDDPEAAERNARIQERLVELERIAEALAPVRDLQKRRNELLYLLRQDEVPYRVIAKHDGAGEEACRVAVNKYRQAMAGDPITRRKQRRKR